MNRLACVVVVVVAAAACGTGDPSIDYCLAEAECEGRETTADDCRSSETFKQSEKCAAEYDELTACVLSDTKCENGSIGTLILFDPGESAPASSGCLDQRQNYADCVFSD